MTHIDRVVFVNPERGKMPDYFTEAELEVTSMAEKHPPAGCGIHHGRPRVLGAVQLSQLLCGVGADRSLRGR